MKKTILLITFICITTSLFARTCVNYIDDEWRDSRYTVSNINGDTVVVDNITQLMWKQCSEGLSGMNCTSGSINEYTWEQALLRSQSVNDVTGFAGFSDWRLPNIKELQSLVALNCYDPSINETVFPNTQSDWYWSSSPTNGFGSELAWFVYFTQSNGLVDADIRTNSNYVRLVRAGQ